MADDYPTMTVSVSARQTEEGARLSVSAVCPSSPVPTRCGCRAGFICSNVLQAAVERHDFMPSGTNFLCLRPNLQTKDL